MAACHGMVCVLHTVHAKHTPFHDSLPYIKMHGATIKFIYIYIYNPFERNVECIVFMERLFWFRVVELIIISVSNFQIVTLKKFSVGCCFSANRSKSTHFYLNRGFSMFLLAVFADSGI